MSNAANNQGSDRPSARGPADAVGSSHDRRKDPLLGQVVNDRFKILSVIARGGMGKVYQAEQAPLGRICALKVLNPKYDGDEDPEFQRRFYLEASTAAKLSHANTVTIFDYGRDEQQDIYYIAMEYVRGRTLFRVLREEGPLAEHRVAHILREVGRSLREAHDLGVIHRDMKPANIMLVAGADEDDAVKVLDFGLVKDVTGDDQEDLTQQGLFMGSPKYMAPEQILGNPVSPATDVYSLGVVAYELLTGEVPFDKGASVKTLMAHVNEAPRSMQSVKPNMYLSAEMNSIVMRCLAKGAADRYQSMDELLRALTKVEGGGTLTESLLAGPVVHPSGANHDDVYKMLAADPMDSNPTRPMARSSVSGSVPVGIADPDSVHPDSILPSGHPSATPQPMEQLALDELDMPKKSSTPIRVAIGAVTVMALAALGFAFSGPAPETTARSPQDTAQTAASAATPSATTAPPRVRSVRVTSEPSGAKVQQGDVVRCGATPCNVTWRDDDVDKTHELALSLTGHETTTLEVPADADEVAGTLTKLPAKPAGVRPPPPPPVVSPQPSAQPGKTKTPSGYKDSPY